MANRILHNENELLLRIAEGDEISFRRVFDHYKPMIYTAALRMTGDSSLSEDILQDTFLKVWLNRISLPEMQNFPGWLYTVSHNLMYDAITFSTRQKKGFRELIKGMAVRSNSDTDYSVQEKEFQGILKKAVDRLPYKQQQTYILVKMQELSRQHAADMLKVSPETIKSNLDLAMRSIRAYCLKELENNSLPVLVIIFSISFY